MRIKCVAKSRLYAKMPLHPANSFDEPWLRHRQNENTVGVRQAMTFSYELSVLAQSLCLRYNKFKCAENDLPLKGLRECVNTQQAVIFIIYAAGKIMGGFVYIKMASL